MATREVARARAELQEIERGWRRETGFYRARVEQAKFRLGRALAQEQRLREELQRLEYTARAAFGVMTLEGRKFVEPGGRVTFINPITERQLKARIHELRARLSEGPG